MKNSIAKIKSNQIFHKLYTVIGQPVAAMFLVSEEIRRLSGFVAKLLDKTRIIFNNNNSNEVRTDFNNEYSTIKNLHDNISSYITKMLSIGNLTEAQSEQTVLLLL